MKGQALLLAIIIMMGSLFIGCSGTDSDNPATTDLKNMVVVFVGASITEGWNFVTYFPGYNFSKVICFDWDKTQAWSETAADNPRIVLVKECGAYFYEDGTTPLDEYYDCMIDMVSRIRNIGAIPVLCTVLPIDVGVGGCTQAQLDDIRDYNAWVRNYCLSNNVTCMEYYNQIADADGQLPANYHDGDGLHPNDAGYAALSPIVIPTLEGCL